MHLLWNLCEQPSAFTIWPVLRASMHIAQLDVSYSLLDPPEEGSSYLKAAYELIILRISSGESSSSDSSS